MSIAHWLVLFGQLAVHVLDITLLDICICVPKYRRICLQSRKYKQLQRYQPFHISRLLPISSNKLMSIPVFFSINNKHGLTLPQPNPSTAHLLLTCQRNKHRKQGSKKSLTLHFTTSPVATSKLICMLMCFSSALHSASHCRSHSRRQLANFRPFHRAKHHNQHQALLSFRSSQSPSSRQDQAHVHVHHFLSTLYTVTHISVA